MNVVGGAYRERCVFPPRDDVVGSGVRAAAALKELDRDVQLWSAVDSTLRVPVEVVVSPLGIDSTFVERREPVEFSYFTPLSTPAVNGAQSTHDELRVDGDVTLVFRMIERGDVSVHSQHVVLDPQQPRDLEKLDLGWIDADHVALVANRSEASALSGIKTDADHRVTEAAEELLRTYEVDVVVVKLGAQGSVVVAADESGRVGSFPTPRVYPIGSGDVFAAGFAWAWAVDGRHPVEAARAGSRLAAAWCSEARFPVPASAIDEPVADPELEPRPCRVYLAAPFFSLAERWLVELVRDSLLTLGAEVFSPCHDVGGGGDEVAGADIAGLRECDSVLALLDGDDPGTLFEVGWARAEGMPVVGFARQPDAEGAKMLRGTEAELYDDLSTAVYRAIWAGVANSRVVSA
jgi:pfkB family carbohydrate kinase/Nucleoside 2-deoxyribosyltransferase